MRAPLLSIVLLAVVATGPLVPVCRSRSEKSGSNGEASPAAAAAGSSVKPLSVDGYGPLEKVAEKPKEEKSYVQATPAKTSDTYDQKPVKKVEMDTASPRDEIPDTYEQSPIPDKEVEEALKKENAHEAEYLKKLKKEKKEKEKEKEKENSDDLDESTSSKKKKKKSHDLDESTSSKKEKKEKYDDSDESSVSKKAKKEKHDDSDESLSSKKKKKTEKSDDSDEDASHKKKKKKSDDDSDESASGKKEKKQKSDDSDIVSHKKEKKEKSIDSNASAYVNKEEKKSHDSDEVTSAKKEKKEKKKKKEKEEKSGEDATPVDVSTNGKYVSPKEENPNEDAVPVDVSATGQYVSSSKADGKPKGGEPESSTTAKAYPSPKQVVAPGELPPAVKSSTTSDAYASPKQDASSQPTGGTPDVLPPAAKSSASPDAYASPQQVAASSQPVGGAPDELPPAAKSSGTPAAYDSPDGAVGQQPNQPAAKPQLSMEDFSGMIKTPIVNFMTPAIKSLCGTTNYPADCEASITGLPGATAAAAADKMGVMKLAMEAVRQKVVVALNAATDRMNAAGTDPTTKEALSSCTSSYMDMKNSLDTVDDALKRGDVDTAKTNLDTVETDVTTCDDGFNDRGTPSVMKDHDQELQKLAINLVAIGQGIKRY